MYSSTVVALAIALFYTATLASPVVPPSIGPPIDSTRPSNSQYDERTPTEKRSEHAWIDDFDNLHTLSDAVPAEPAHKPSRSKFTGLSYLASFQQQLKARGNAKSQTRFSDLVSQTYSNGVGFDEYYVQGFFWGLVGVLLFSLAVAFFYAASRYLVPATIVQTVSRRQHGHRRGESRWSL